MMTEYESRKLQYHMRRELGATHAAVWKCAAALLIVVAVATVGSMTELRHGNDGTVAAATQTGQSSGPATRIQAADAR